MESIMNRPLKFRVWDKYQNKFLPSYGDLGILFYHEQGESWHSKGIRDIVPVSWFLTAHNNNLGNYIVQQYTGLKDSKGTDIYEGDIYYDKIYKAYCQCIWDVERLTYRWVGKNMSLPIGPRDDDMSVEVKIVGNIFENPELLN